MLFFNYIFAGIYTVRFRDLLEIEPYVQLTTKYWGTNGTINLILHILHNNMSLIKIFIERSFAYYRFANTCQDRKY